MKKKRRLPFNSADREAAGWTEHRGNGQMVPYWRDPYHLLLTIPWSGFSTNCLRVSNRQYFVCLIYLAGGDGIDEPGNFFDAFFSVSRQWLLLAMGQCIHALITQMQWLPSKR